MTDRRLEQIVGNLLRTGVALAAAVVLAGGIWYLAAHGASRPDYRRFHAGPGAMPWSRDLRGPLAAIQLGLLILIATPVARVVFSLVAFGLERDKVYVTITLVVLVILVYSLAYS
jgi:uncharacterized membrane protein